jgi:hypothetical protein
MVTVYPETMMKKITRKFIMSENICREGTSDRHLDNPTDRGVKRGTLTGGSREGH